MSTDYEQLVIPVVEAAGCAKKRARNALEESKGNLEDAICIAKQGVSTNAAAPAPPAAAFASLAAPATRVTSVEGVFFDDMTIQYALIHMIGNQNPTDQRDFAALMLPTNDPIRRAAPGFIKVVCAYGWLGGKGKSSKEGYARDPNSIRNRTEDGMIWANPGEELIKYPWQTWVHFFAENSKSHESGEIIPWTVYGRQFFEGIDCEHIKVKACEYSSDESDDDS